MYFDKEPSLADLCSGKTFAECITTQVYTGADGENDLYYHDGTGSYTNADQEAGDNSYRYTGANPNNYVCFGSDEETCPADNLYRIIGVFDGQVKLIKADYANSDLLGTDGDFSMESYSDYWGESSEYKGSMDQSTIPLYYWNINGTNKWSESSLNTVNLNINYIDYLDGIDSKWTNVIATTEWKVGGMLWSDTNTAKQYYDAELGSNSRRTTYSEKIGLMYVSDYGYAADPSYWTAELYNYEPANSSNWMFMGLYEWTISPRSDYSDVAFGVIDTGIVGVPSILEYCGVRPSFYLQPWVLYSRGDGTQENPYRISAPDNLIEFTVNYENFYAEDDMSFYDFVNSIYNNGDFSINGICQVEYNSRGMVYDGNGGVFPIVQDYIISETLDSAGNQNYRTGMYDPGLPDSFC